MSDPALVFDALGNPTRRAILGLLHGGPMSVTRIAQRLPVTRPAVSQQLRVLEQARLVRQARAGRERLFRLDREGFTDAHAWLDGFWDEALQRFASLVEREGA